MNNLQVSNLSPKNVINFRADNNNKYYPQRVSLTQDDDILDLQDEIKKQKKKQRTQNIKQNLSWGVSIAASLGMIAMAWAVLRGKGGVEEQAKALTDAVVEFIDMKGSKKVAGFDAGTTDQSLVEQARKIMTLDKPMPEWLQKFTGVKKKAKCLYLYGHGGTGKSYFAEQLAQERNAYFVSAKYPDFGSPFKDASSMKVTGYLDKVMQFCKQHTDREAILCIDEGDALIKVVADAAHGAEEAGKTRAAVLTAIDKILKECPNLTVIVTSNYHPDNGMVDPIVLRRFAYKLEATLPDFKRADSLLKLNLKNIGAIKPEFYESQEYKNFVEDLVKKGYSSGEIDLISQNAGESFAQRVLSIEGLTEDKAKEIPFTVEYLIKGMKEKGKAASLSNKLMDVDPNSNEELRNAMCEMYNRLSKTWKEKPLDDVALKQSIKEAYPDFQESHLTSIMKVLKPNLEAHKYQELM